MKLSDFSEQREEVFSLYNKQLNDVKADILVLRKWMLKVPHLPSERIQDEFIELCLLKNKFSIEKCKKKIEMYCTVKADPHYDYIFNRIPVPTKEASFYTPLPMLTDDYKRLIFFRIYDEKAFNLAKDISSNVFLREFLLRYDYSDGEILIIDMRNVSASIVSKFRMNVFADGRYLTMVRHEIQLCIYYQLDQNDWGRRLIGNNQFRLYFITTYAMKTAKHKFWQMISAVEKEAFSARISAMHVISKIGQTIFSVITPFFKKKLVSRIHFHEDKKSLKEVIPAKYLPSDYGGHLKPLDEIRADWYKIFEDNRECLKTFSETKSREELRQPDGSKDEEMQGTFKKLCID